MRKTTSLFAGCLLGTAVFAAASSWADDGMIAYEITVTNLTPGQTVAPVMAATHRPGISFFTPGAPPMPELADLAEAGNGHPMADKLKTLPGYSDAEVGAAGADPGQSTTVTVKAHDGTDHLSLGAMLGNTNDAFIALRDVKLPRGGHTVVYMADGYDAGTETNDESCGTVPGPACGGVALSPGDSGEGFVYIHNGIHGIGGLDPALYDWRNPAARVEITRVHQSQ